ncbi:MAG: alanine dehydrogenase [Pseudohongiellaceae bacterium]
MIVGVPREIKAGERRVGMTPESVRLLTEKGHTVIVERDAATAIGMSDEAYAKGGARLTDRADEVYRDAELIVKVKEPQLEECARLRAGQAIFTYLHLAAYREIAEALLGSGVTCIAYETVTDSHGGLPLLIPMSEVAGRMAIQAAAHSLETSQGGSGVLLPGAPGVLPGKILILGAGVVGVNAARMAAGLGARVTIMDLSPDKLRQIEQLFWGKIDTLLSTPGSIERQLPEVDVVIGAALVPGGSAPRLISREMLKLMKRGSVLVDVAIDQGGCFETSRPTRHDDPTYLVDGIVHYCVANIPGAVPKTSTYALCNATLPVISKLANKGVLEALREDEHLRNGLNIHRGGVTHEAVAKALGKDLLPALESLSE